jgi:hypothetical protein
MKIPNITFLETLFESPENSYDENITGALGNLKNMSLSIVETFK